MTEFFGKSFADFSYVVRVKKIEDFVQPLVAFPISNISYYMPVRDVLGDTYDTSPLKQAQKRYIL